MQVVKGYKPVPLDKDEEENQLNIYNWIAYSEEPAHELSLNDYDLSIKSENKEEILSLVNEICNNL